jgi:hypothetical protein
LEGVDVRRKPSYSIESIVRFTRYLTGAASKKGKLLSANARGTSTSISEGWIAFVPRFLSAHFRTLSCPRQRRSSKKPKSIHCCRDPARTGDGLNCAVGRTFANMVNHDDGNLEILSDFAKL